MLFITITFYFLAVRVITNETLAQLTHAAADHCIMAIRASGTRIAYLSCHRWHCLKSCFYLHSSSLGNAIG